MIKKYLRARRIVRIKEEVQARRDWLLNNHKEMKKILPEVFEQQNNFMSKKIYTYKETNPKFVGSALAVTIYFDERKKLDDALDEVTKTLDKLQHKYEVDMFIVEADDE